MRSKIISAVAIVFTVLLVISISSCDHQAVPPQQVLTYDEANAIEEHYIETRYNILNDTLGFEDTREFWFSLDSLKKYIEYVEYEAKKQSLQNLGVRIYFGAYPPNSNYPDAGYSTVFIVPTAQSSPSPLKQGFVPIQPTNDNIEGLMPLNYGHGGQPPTGF
ncbi:MAG: hypothetical protein K8F54_10890 [Altibacter sp.]|uniref:hypothetical protein n=1 Tax=Altibacter sp. TaxID=2024823 RepID=UPI001D5363C6|nr:hypothetical protein [Altibacter sp.]MBZ0328102.1 hypothetical protein [Altibacter sp.]